MLVILHDLTLQIMARQRPAYHQKQKVRVAVCGVCGVSMLCSHLISYQLSIHSIFHSLCVLLWHDHPEC